MSGSLARDLRMSRRTALGGMVTAGLVAGTSGWSLRPAAGQEATPAAGTYPVLPLVATEYSFDMPATAESGYTRITFDNQGAEDHHAIFLRLNDDATMEELQEAMMADDIAAIMQVASAYGGPNVGPGQQSTVIVFLDPGSYLVVCAIPDEQGIPHAAHGMVSMLEVTEGTAAAQDPVAAGTISMVEMAFEGLPTEVAAGPVTWAVVNNGTQLHELSLLAVAPALSADAAIDLIAQPGTPEPAPAATPGASAVLPVVSVGGTAPMSPGATNYVELDLVPGEYIAICFVPDLETGMPHYMMGMVASFVVT